MSKIIFITGGVVSSLGKGIAASSIGSLLKENNFKINVLKMDPYINFDPGTISPYEHGEVYITSDGGETDLDLGHYERFIDIKLNKSSNITSGKIYHSVIEKERRGDYGGKTVQVIPHVTNEIKNYIYKLQKNNPVDFLIIEIGGTVGDIESLPYIETMRQIKMENENDVLIIHNTLVPIIKAAGEAKTKPTQHSIQSLRSFGINPDILILRSEEKLSYDIKAKLARFTYIKEERIFFAPDVKSIYEVPLVLHSQGIEKAILSALSMSVTEISKPTKWESYKIKSQHTSDSKSVITIGLVGKYTVLKDAYLSVKESIMHASAEIGKKVNIKWINSEETNINNYQEIFSNIDAILVCGGFGIRGVEGKILAAQFARENKVPYLGICLGMQVAIIEFARNVLKMTNANSTEFDPNTKYPVIDIVRGKKSNDNIGGTLRLGEFKTNLTVNSLAAKTYGSLVISERHRHRFEFNNKFNDNFENSDLIFSGKSQKENLVEMIELKNHPFFIATQAHPEFNSRPNKPNPLFKSLIEAGFKNQKH